MAEKLKKSGVAVLIGRSNAGKSTLLNSLVGTKVAIATPKPQTTRHVIHGVLHEPRGQIVFVDTPGIFTRIPDLLTSKLNEKAKDALEGIDVVLYVADPSRHVGDEEKAVHRVVKTAKSPKILVLNKSDLERPYIDEYLAWKDDFDEIIEVSGLDAKNLKTLVDLIFAHLPIGEPLYPEGQLTGAENKFWLEELIREKVFLKMHEEVPYTVTVEVEENATRENGAVYIRAAILTTSPRYRKMLIGAGGRTIKSIGSAVRKELEAVTGQKTYIELYVRVEEKWQERFK